MRNGRRGEDEDDVGSGSETGTMKGSEKQAEIVFFGGFSEMGNEQIPHCSVSSLEQSAHSLEGERGVAGAVLVGMIANPSVFPLLKQPRRRREGSGVFVGVVAEVGFGILDEPSSWERDFEVGRGVGRRGRGEEGEEEDSEDN